MPFLLQPELAYRPAPGISASEHRRTLHLYLWRRADERCALCLLPLELAAVSPDHIIPKSKGGGDGVDNLQATHWPCNLRKRARSMDEAVALIRHGVPMAPRRNPTPAVRWPHTPEPPMLTPTTVLVEPLTTLEIAAELRMKESMFVTFIRTGRLTATAVTEEGGYIVERTEIERFLRERRGE